MNKIQSTIPTPKAPGGRNEGRFRKLKEMSVATGAAASLAKNFQSEITLTAANRSFVNCDNDKQLTWHVIACLPLRYLSDFFKNTPLMRGALLSVTLNTHVPSQFTLAASAPAGDALSTYTETSSVSPFGFQPLMITQASKGTVEGGLKIETAGNVTGRLTIGNILQTGCVCHVPQYTLSPEAESRYNSNPVRPITYLDHTTSTGLKVTAGNSSNNFQVTSNTGCLRRLLICPYLAGAADASGNGSMNVSSLLSPYTSAGATTVAPFAYLQQLNVAIGGKNIWQESKSYRYPQWVEEIYGENSNNAGMTHGFINTSISKADYDTMYGYVSINIGRRGEAEDKVAKSLTVNFQNGCAKTCEYVIFLFYEKSISVDVNTGQLVV